MKAFTDFIVSFEYHKQQERPSEDCPGLGWDGVNFPLSSCCVLDLVGEEC